MDDNTKIQVLMVYYKHWGNEQNKIRKTIQGATQLLSMRLDIYTSVCAYLQRHTKRSKHAFVDLLLKPIGGSFTPIEFLHNCYVNRKQKLYIRLKEYMDEYTLDAILFGFGFTDQDTLSVDAIVALL